MNKNFLFVLSCGFAFACSGLFSVSYAEIYKCKNSDGTISYSERPCSGSSVKQVAPWADDDKLSPKDAERKDKIMRQTLKDIDAAFNELHQRCKNGDMKACKETACGVAMTPEGTMDDLALCAKSKGLPYGRDWAIVSGKSFSTEDSSSVKNSLNRTNMTETGFLQDLTMGCWRKKSSPDTFGYYNVPLVETVFKKKGDDRLTFEYRSSSYRPGEGKPPTYPSLEQAAKAYCRD